MIKEILEKELKANGRLVPKRCLEPYLIKVGLYDLIVENSVDLKDLSLTEKIQSLLQGIFVNPICENSDCNNHVVMADGKYQRFCSLKCMANSKNIRRKTSQTRRENGVSKEISKEFLIEHYIDKKWSMNKISKHIDASNVMVAYYLKKHGIQKRIHSEEISLTSTTRGTIRPIIPMKIDDVREMYEVKKMPLKSIAKIYNCHTETIRNWLVNHNIPRSGRRSWIEQFVIDICDEFNIEHVTNKKNILPNLDIDIFVPSLNLGFETNGSVTHTHVRDMITGNEGKPKDYHYNKYKLAKDANVRLMQFWEFDIDKRPEIVRSMIMNALGLIQNKIAARKCSVANLSYSEASAFCDANHIQGKPSRNSRSIGLRYNGQLVSLISYTQGKEYNTITRYCSLLEHQVQGGFSKLLKHVPGTVLRTYSHNDISDGDLYRNNGFVMIVENKRDLWYTDYNKIYNRQLFMKHKLTHMSGYAEDKTEQEIMIDSGFDLIFKSGTKTWQLVR